jgi:hypothetical protein
MNNAKVLS